MGQKLFLIALDLKEIIPALVHDRSGQPPLTVQWIGRERLTFQGGKGRHQGHRRRLLATLSAFLLIHHRQGHGRAVLMVGQSHRANHLADHLPIQTQGRGQSARVLT